MRFRTYRRARWIGREGRGPGVAASLSALRLPPAFTHLALINAVLHVISQEEAEA